MAADLRALLAALAIGPPYVLVGHSWGGVVARTFVHAYPADVVGLVLVDATHEVIDSRGFALLPVMYTLMGAAARFGAGRRWLLAQICPAGAPPGTARSWSSGSATGSSGRLACERRGPKAPAFARRSRRWAATVPNCPAIPVHVLTAGGVTGPNVKQIRRVHEAWKAMVAARAAGAVHERAGQRPSDADRGARGRQQRDRRRPAHASSRSGSGSQGRGAPVMVARGRTSAPARDLRHHRPHRIAAAGALHRAAADARRRRPARGDTARPRARDDAGAAAPSHLPPVGARRALCHRPGAGVQLRRPLGDRQDHLRRSDRARAGPPPAHGPVCGGRVDVDGRDAEERRRALSHGGRRERGAPLRRGRQHCRPALHRARIRARRARPTRWSTCC